MPTAHSDILYTDDFDPNYTVYIIDHLFGAPLYAYYVVVIDRFEDGDIQGTLMTCPIDIEGPFTSYEDALKILTDL